MENEYTIGEKLLILVMNRKYSKGIISNLVYTSLFTKKKQEYFQEALDLLEDGTATELDLHRWTQRKLKVLMKEMDARTAIARERCLAATEDGKEMNGDS